MKTLSPEQKRRRWLILGIVAISYVLSFFQRFAPAGIAQDLASAFETSAASLGVLAATYFYVYTAAFSSASRRRLMSPCSGGR